MHILYDCTPLLMQSAGVKNYHHTLLRNLIPNIAPHQISLFPYLKTLRPNRNQSSNYPRWDTAWRLGGILASNYLKVPFPERAAKRADLFHITQHIRHPPWNICLTSMIHDPTPLLMPEMHRRSTVTYFREFMGNTLKRLNRLLAPSEAVKKDLVERFHLPPDAVSVVYHGVDADFFESNASALYLAKNKHHLPDRYMLTVGSLEPRKNLMRLIEAFSILPETIQRNYPLVVVGGSGWKNKQIKRVLSRSPYIVLAGYVNRALLPSVYHSATLFIFPSLYEGFGLPLLEAMAGRVPVITSNSSAMPEITGEAALHIDPLSVKEMAAAMERLIESPDAAARLGEAGRARAREFTWARTAERTKLFFEEALGS